LRHRGIAENPRKVMVCAKQMAHCVVSFLDTDGLRQSVEVQAEGFYGFLGAQTLEPQVPTQLDATQQDKPCSQPSFEAA